ncbi:MAG: DNA topoisomerase 3 [Legionellales bacterium]|nr:DNA topoisomerase 3 [Legionellales bacterium]
MTTLYICEKPSQARDIARVVGAHERQEGYIQGDDIKVTWCLGHLLELAPPDSYCENIKPWRMDVLPILPKEWQLIPNKKTKSQLSIIKKLLKQSDCVIIATDADREGDVIGRELLDYFHYDGEVKRLWLSALDDSSIMKALSNIRSGDSTYPLYLAGLGRQRADWAIGMNMTMATSCLYGIRGQGVLSVGRVQTPALGLIVKRDLEIENFKPKDYFDLHALFNSANGEFNAKWIVPEDLSDEEGRCLNKSNVDTIINKLNGESGVVKHFSNIDKKTSPPTCFSLSGLQKLCSSKLGLTAKQTLQIAQSLYEKHKATTYPRTDSGYLPEEQFSDASNILETLSNTDESIKELINECDASLKSPTWNDKKVTAHHGIIPTNHSNIALSDMSEDEFKVYDLIRRYYIAQFLGNYEYQQRRVEVDCAGEVFKSSYNEPLKPGWKRALNIEQIEDGNEENGTTIPFLKEDQSVDLKSTDIKAKQTKPPSRFTEGTLISSMKNIAKFVNEPEMKKILRDTSGIGTEATRADIIEKLINRGFIERKKKQLISTKRGRSLIDIVPEQMKNPATTALWEQELDNIAEGKGELSEFLLDQEEVLEFMLEDLSSMRELKAKTFDTGVIHPCPKCKSPLIKRKGKNGYFWGCSRYPDCNTVMQDKKGKPQKKTDVAISDIECPNCKNGRLVRRKAKKKGYWWGCNQYPNCKASYVDGRGKPKLDTPQNKRANEEV